MKKFDNLASQFSQLHEKRRDSEPQGYPLYPENEDIYKKLKKLRNIDPEDVSKIKEIRKLGKRNEKDFEENLLVGDLDIPGIEIDEDDDEMIDIEDEENDYYSLGGDDHFDLKENFELPKKV